MPSDEIDPPGSDGDSLDGLFAVMARPRRRAVLECFLDGDDDVMDLDALARLVADRAPGTVEETDIAIDLHHVHLPKLAEAGVVEYDPRSAIVRYRGDDRIPAIRESIGAGETNPESPSSSDR